ncbi:MAG TPA: hypothetical protein VD902_20450 [Symbiobacteriaceae bacterium]|nr:hypothetical protein [Symbiobacteriaceae bacterium]
MSEERKLILQMVADGKITADEAEKLLQALEETERQVESTATEQVQRDAAEPHDFRFQDLGRIIERTVSESLRGLDDTLRDLEVNLDRKLNDPSRQRLFSSIEESVRRSAERAVERAHRMEERAAHAAERASRRAEEISRRAAERAAEHRARFQLMQHGNHPHGMPKTTMYKMGVVIDRVQVERNITLVEQAQPGDHFVLDNRVGDLKVEYYDGDTIQVSVRQQVWGEDEADANARADLTQVKLLRTGPNDVTVVVERPTISAVGVVVIKDTRHDFTVRLPHHVHLDASARVGDIVLMGGDKVGVWRLSTKVGDVDVKVGRDAEFTYELTALNGRVHTELSGPIQGENREQIKRGEMLTGRVGEGGGGRLEVTAKTGNIRVIH